MTGVLLNSQPLVKQVVAAGANDGLAASLHKLRVARRTRRQAGKSPRRFHYLVERAAVLGKSQADITRETGVDKGTVSRWFAGTIPRDNHLILLVGVLHLEEPAELFRHPDDDWLAKLFRGRDEEERQRMLRTLETAFPRKTR